MSFFVDITRDQCPITLVRVKLQLSRMKEGEILDILLSDGEPLNNVPRALKEHGHRIIELKPDKSPYYKLTIEK